MTQPLSPRAMDFLLELSVNNQRPWFSEHREEFEAVLHRPFKELAEETCGLMRERFPDCGFCVHVSRIYRDARRLFGRGPYHDHLWFSLQREDCRHQGPMLWFEFGLSGTSHGLGYWERSAQQAAAFRRKIDSDPKRFEELLLAVPDRERSRLWGDEYKRPKGSYNAVIDPWYNRKQASIGYDDYFGGQLFTDRLPGLLAGSFGGLMGLYHYMMEAAGLELRLQPKE